MHQNRPSFEGGTVGSCSALMNCCFQRSEVQRVSLRGVEAFLVKPHRHATPPARNCRAPARSVQDGALHRRLGKRDLVLVAAERLGLRDGGVRGCHRRVGVMVLPTSASRGFGRNPRSRRNVAQHHARALDGVAIHLERDTRHRERPVESSALTDFVSSRPSNSSTAEARSTQSPFRRA